MPAEVEAKNANALTETDTAVSQPEIRDGAFSKYSDEELEQILTDIRRSDEDAFVSVAHSAAVKD